MKSLTNKIKNVAYYHILYRAAYGAPSRQSKIHSKLKILELDSLFLAISYFLIGSILGNVPYDIIKWAIKQINDKSKIKTKHFNGLKNNHDIRNLYINAKSGINEMRNKKVGLQIQEEILIDRIVNLTTLTNGRLRYKVNRKNIYSKAQKDADKIIHIKFTNNEVRTLKKIAKNKIFRLKLIKN